MAKKRRLSENAVDSLPWIRKTTENAEEPKPVTKGKAKPSKLKSAIKARTVTKINAAAARSTPERLISVEFDTKNGAIISTHEMVCEAEEITSEHGTSVSESAVAGVALTGELFDKALIDIHNNYKVVISKKKPTLVPKG